MLPRILQFGFNLWVLHFEIILKKFEYLSYYAVSTLGSGISLIPDLFFAWAQMEILSRIRFMPE